MNAIIESDSSNAVTSLTEEAKLNEFKKKISETFNALTKSHTDKRVLLDKVTTMLTEKLEAETNLTVPALAYIYSLISKAEALSSQNLIKMMEVLSGNNTAVKVQVEQTSTQRHTNEQTSPTIRAVSDDTLMNLN